MSHHKPPVKIDTYGREVRLRRDRRGSPSSLTKGHKFSDLPNPHPDGGKPTTAWTLHYYPLERKRRKRRAEEKRIERRRLLTKGERAALKDWDD